MKNALTVIIAMMSVLVLNTCRTLNYDNVTRAESVSQAKLPEDKRRDLDLKLLRDELARVKNDYKIKLDNLDRESEALNTKEAGRARELEMYEKELAGIRAEREERLLSDYNIAVEEVKARRNAEVERLVGELKTSNDVVLKFAGDEAARNKYRAAMSAEENEIRKRRAAALEAELAGLKAGFEKNKNALELEMGQKLAGFKAAHPDLSVEIEEGGESESPDEPPAESALSGNVYADPRTVTGISRAPSINKGMVGKIGLALLILIFIAFVVANRVRKSGGKESAEDEARGIDGRNIVSNMRGSVRSTPVNAPAAGNADTPAAAAPDDGDDIADVFTDARGNKYIVTKNGKVLTENEADKLYDNRPFYTTQPEIEREGQPPAYNDSGNSNTPPPPEHSRLVPEIEGSLGNIKKIEEQSAAAASPGRMSYDEYLAQSAAASRQAMAGMPQYQAPTPAAAVNEYDAQNAQSDKRQFFSGQADGTTITSGQYIIEDTIWAGTIIPGVLVTAISTDLPGEVLARVSRNIYDTRTGKRLLVPQGSTLIARYNSSVSYAQNRVQIVWDMLIRPDGYQVTLDGMNGVDAEGYSGQGGKYHENWFQYLKAAGIIAMFTIANSKMTEAIGSAGGDVSSAAMEANANVMTQLGSNIISRALNIQPTITVDSGTPINIMLNKNVYLPPVDDYPVKNKYKR